MARIYLLFLLLLSQFDGMAQTNIVPNYSFEEHLACPKNSILYKDSFNRFFDDWFDPTNATPDYYNICGTDQMGIPKNLPGEQDAYEGNAYIGMLMSSIPESGDTNEYFHNWREYVTIEIPELEVGATYNVSLWLSLADNSEFATEAPSILFSKDLRSDIPTTRAIPRMPQVNFGQYGFIDNRKDWVQVSQNFIADSTYDQITIGNFTPEDRDIKLKSSYNYFVWEAIKLSYYYIDNVEVRKIADKQDKDISVSFTYDGKLLIYGTTDQPTTIKVLNVAGQVVYSEELQPLSNFIKLEVALRPYLATGIYFVRVGSGYKASTLKCMIE